MSESKNKIKIKHIKYSLKENLEKKMGCEGVGGLKEQKRQLN
jgi:hypothetical protein